MRTDKMMMINTDPDSMAAFKRARAYKAIAALLIVFSFGVLAVIAPPTDSGPMVGSALATKSADTSVSSRNDPYLGHGASIDELTNGVDMHG